MGGAYTAIGSDLSTLWTDPRRYRHISQVRVGITLDLNFQSFQASVLFDDRYAQPDPVQCKQRFGYIGTMKLYSGRLPPTFSFWCVILAYRIRLTTCSRATFNSLAGLRLSTIMWLTFLPTRSILWTTGYSPYRDVDLSGAVITIRKDNAPWMSVLAYNSLHNNQWPGELQWTEIISGV